MNKTDQRGPSESPQQSSNAQAASGNGRVDPSHNLAPARRNQLNVIFQPSSVAVVGASEKPASVGNTLLKNLISGRFKGEVFAVNPRYKQIAGVLCAASIRELPRVPDLAVIATPAATVPQVISDCAALGVPGAVVISAGFKEQGEEGKRLEAEIKTILGHAPTRLIGPNCLGVMVPSIGLNATFAQEIALPGTVAFASQSGALLTAILDWSMHEHVGFSAFISTGSMLDVNWGDLIFYLGDDPNTHAILLYMESIGDARSFLSAAREVALTKPIVVIKTGRSAMASRAAASHTGALTGSDEVVEAAFRRCGVLRVDSISDLFSMAEVLGKQPRPKGPKLMIATNAGGPGVLATDALIANGGDLAPLSENSSLALNSFLPQHWSHNNPVDILGDAEPERYAKTLEVLSRDPNADGILVVLAPQGMTDPLRAAEQVVPYAHCDKPILASWMGGAVVQPGDDLLAQAGIPTFRFPDTAARIFTYMWRYSENLRALYETPAADSQQTGTATREHANTLLLEAAKSGRTLLSEAESKQLLDFYGIPTVPTTVVTSEDAAVAAARQRGFPVVLKLHSYTVTHKSDVGGVKLNLTNDEQVRAAFSEIRGAVRQRFSDADFLGVTVQPMITQNGLELILGSSTDSQFGPVLLFGAGGVWVEAFGDRALALPPLNTTLARRVMERTRVWKALQNPRGGESIDLRALEQLLVRFSELVINHPRIKEMDINPLLVSDIGMMALDARVVLYGAGVADDDIPRTAIRPYPAQYVFNVRLRDGEQILVRPIRPEDEPAMVEFHHSLSERSVYYRYSMPLTTETRTAHDRLTRLCFIDYSREMALVAEHVNHGARSIVAVGRVTPITPGERAEIALLVSDNFQKHGIGGELLRLLAEVARKEGVLELAAYILPGNVAMQKLARAAGFTFDAADDDMLHAVLRLR